MILKNARLGGREEGWREVGKEGGRKGRKEGGKDANRCLGFGQEDGEIGG